MSPRARRPRWRFRGCLSSPPGPGRGRLVDPATLQTVLAGGGAFGVVVLLIILGQLVPGWVYKRAVKESARQSARKDAEIAKLQEALALERQRSNDTTQAGAVTIQ